jgi:hypothetical protein
MSEYLKGMHACPFLLPILKTFENTFWPQNCGEHISLSILSGTTRFLEPLGFESAANNVLILYELQFAQRNDTASYIYLFMLYLMTCQWIGLRS